MASYHYDNSCTKSRGGTVTSPVPPTPALVYTNGSYYEGNEDHRNPVMTVLQYVMPLGLTASKGETRTGEISNETRWVATECSLELYVRSFQASVQNSGYQETTLASWSSTVTAPWDAGNKAMQVGFIVPENISLGVYKGQKFMYGQGADTSIYFNFFNWLNGTAVGGDGMAFSFTKLLRVNMLRLTRTALQKTS